jgi:cation diffusion facilitator CzcD-associated flavoprotein CzcO
MLCNTILTRSSGPGYLEAFTQSNVSFTTSPITRITATGILTADGTHHAVDAIVCATGFDVSHRPPFSLIGLDNVDLRGYSKDEFPGYFSVAGPHFPNSSSTPAPTPS